MVPVVTDAAGGEEREIVARIFCCPSENTEVVRAAAKFAIAAYLNVPVYAAFHEWLGRGDQLQGMWDAWKAGDRKAALAAIPDQVVDDLIVHGSPAAVSGNDPGVLRQRRDDELARDPAARPRARLLAGGHRPVTVGGLTPLDDQPSSGWRHFSRENRAKPRSALMNVALLSRA